MSENDMTADVCGRTGPAPEVPVDVDAYIRDTIAGQLRLDVWDNYTPTLLLLTRKDKELVHTPIPMPEEASMAPSAAGGYAVLFALMSVLGKMPPEVAYALQDADEFAGVVTFSEAWGLRRDAREGLSMKELMAQIALESPTGIMNHPQAVDSKVATVAWGYGQFAGYIAERGDVGAADPHVADGRLSIALNALYGSFAIELAAIHG